MNVLVCPDKFKLTFSAAEIAEIIAKPLKERGFNVNVLPLSDGGDGFLDTIEHALDVKRVYHQSYDPLMRPINTYFLYDQNENVAYIELAKTGSLAFLSPSQRNPLNTTSYGLGIQIAKALELGCQSIYIGLGGSSTTDAGIGMAAALGWKFLDKNGNELSPIGKNLPLIERILPPEKKIKAHFVGYTDVDNPLYGEKGAAYVYSPQKGATEKQVEFLDLGLRHIAKIIKEQLNKDVAFIKGAGAAGGIGAGIVAFLDGSLSSGALFIAHLIDLYYLIKYEADLVITGEGKLDEQSKYGKVVDIVVRTSRKAKKPVIIVAGKCEISSFDDAKLICLFDQDLPIDELKRQTPLRVYEKLKNFNFEELKTISS